MMDIGNLNMKKIVCSFQTWGTTYPTRPYQCPECCSPHGIRTLQKCFSFCSVIQVSEGSTMDATFHEMVRAWRCFKTKVSLQLPFQNESQKKKLFLDRKNIGE
jgi:hypothetical protein